MPHIQVYDHEPKDQPGCFITALILPAYVQYPISRYSGWILAPPLFSRAYQELDFPQPQEGMTGAETKIKCEKLQGPLHTSFP